MIERACCSVITVSGLDWISASPSSRLRARLSKRPCGLSAAPRPLMVTCDLSIAGGLNGLALLQRRDLGLAVAVGGEHGRGVLAQPRADPFDVPGGGRELGDDSGDLERRAVLSPITRSSSSPRFARPALSESEGSSARSARPMTFISRLKMLSALAPITTCWPSRVR